MEPVIIYQRRSRFPKFLGILFLGFSLAGFLLFLSPFLTPLMLKNLETKTMISGFAPLLDEVVLPGNQFSANEVIVQNFSLTIDKIGLKNAVITPQVVSFAKKDYLDILNQTLVQAQGSSFPGENGLVYIFGHSANFPWFVKNFNAYLWRLDELEAGDRIRLDYNGQTYSYFVADKLIVKPEEVEAVKANLNKDVLVLQTCWPKGTTLKRLLIFSHPSQFGNLI